MRAPAELTQRKAGLLTKVGHSIAVLLQMGRPPKPLPVHPAYRYDGVPLPEAWREIVADLHRWNFKGERHPDYLDDECVPPTTAARCAIVGYNRPHILAETWLPAPSTWGAIADGGYLIEQRDGGGRITVLRAYPDGELLLARYVDGEEAEYEVWKPWRSWEVPR